MDYNVITEISVAMKLSSLMVKGGIYG